MKNLVLISAVVISLVVMAEAKKTQLTSEQKAALQQKIMIIKGGEKIAMPDTQRGTITVVNAQTRAKKDWLVSVVAYLSSETKFNVLFKDGSFNPAHPSVVGDMTIFVVDDPALPRVAVAPDDRWGYCNMAQIFTDKTQFFEARAKKMVARTFAMLCGGMSSSYAISLVGPMPDVKDLDVLPNENIPVDVTIRMNPYLEKFGITPAVLKPYKIACQEGWAPQPTNDVQKAIWDKVHAMPTEPLKIKPETKKQDK